MIVSESDISRFLQKFVVSGTGCWEWQAAKDKYGYGVFQVSPKTIKAHRFSYFILKEKLWEVPLAKSVGTESVSHLCDNNGCVNPQHLVIEPMVDNKRRSTDKITRCPEGHLLKDNEVAWDYKNRKHRTCATCKKEKMAVAYGLAAQAAASVGMGVTEYIDRFGKSVQKSMAVLNGE